MKEVLRSAKKSEMTLQHLCSIPGHKPFMENKDLFFILTNVY